MPLIEFPDVPLAAGVPDVARQAVTQAVGTLPEITVAADRDTVDYIQSPTAWAILYENGTPALEPDSVAAIDNRSEQRLVGHPVEQGSFNTINKVATPYEVRLRLTCSGNGPMTRDSFLAQLRTLVDGIDLLTIVTPDEVFESANLTHIDYRRESRNGVSLLTVDAWFEEVRQAGANPTTSTIAPSGAPNRDGGIVQAPTLSVPSVGAIENYALRQVGLYGQQLTRTALNGAIGRLQVAVSANLNIPGLRSVYNRLYG